MNIEQSAGTGAVEEIDVRPKGRPQPTSVVQRPGEGMKSASRLLPEAKRRALAVAAEVDPRTIARAYAAALDPSVPAPRGMAGDRALRALTEAGLIPAPSLHSGS